MKRTIPLLLILFSLTCSSFVSAKDHYLRFNAVQFSADDEIKRYSELGYIKANQDYSVIEIKFPDQRKSTYCDVIDYEIRDIKGVNGVYFDLTSAGKSFNLFTFTNYIAGNIEFIAVLIFGNEGEQSATFLLIK